MDGAPSGRTFELCQNRTLQLCRYTTELHNPSCGDRNKKPGEPPQQRLSGLDTIADKKYRTVCRVHENQNVNASRLSLRIRSRITWHSRTHHRHLGESRRTHCAQMEGWTSPGTTMGVRASLIPNQAARAILAHARNPTSRWIAFMQQIAFQRITPARFTGQNRTPQCANISSSQQHCSHCQPTRQPNAATAKASCTHRSLPVQLDTPSSRATSPATSRPLERALKS